ncbi:sugar-transfer associated ATP-grasp domain-containing protein [Aquimarina spongiae]|uniref:Sugar-transfer associated ATP-grasp n=1 Tax=Aquimarina spongiae TaxID=570521 RepID=A0A1M6AH98_9FLAO|nr:sugar-transfer associated ATP-grasp domain-containing protein [Aquimarina spongiae]SHI35761.1 Sugar-transfer associated ATP-grasp [Aquimarina spongiae]
MKRKFKLLKKRLDVFFKDPERKSFFRIFREAIGFWMAKKEFPYFYFGKFLYRKDVKNYKDYLSSKEVDNITLSKKLHRPQYATLLRNKLAFALFMEKNNLPVPPMIAYNLKNRFFYNSNFTLVNSKEELATYFNSLFEKEGVTRIFVKAITEMGGVGAYLVTKDNVDQTVEEDGEYIMNNDCIHQEVIIQHEKINELYPHSVNTIRFDTYLDNKGEVHILSGYMRFGRGGSVLDNSSGGGFWVSIDMEKGVLVEKSYQLMKYGGKRFKSHPDTGTVFLNHELPYFKEACDLVKQCVNHIPDRIIGWDIAVSQNGPVIIEGNDNNSLLGPDLVFGGFCKHPLYQEIISNI